MSEPAHRFPPVVNPETQALMLKRSQEQEVFFHSQLNQDAGTVPLDCQEDDA